MRRLFASLASISVLALSIGCNESMVGGQPESDSSFKLTGGGMPAMIKPGDAQSVKITIHRGKNFHQSLRLTTEAPDAVAANLDRNLVKDGEEQDVNVRLRPKEDAPLGEYKVKVIATPDTGAPATIEVTVRVIAK